MSIIDRITSVFRPALRNRPGGMAWIKGIPSNAHGLEELNGRAVKTVRVNDTGNWDIEPSQQVLITQRLSVNHPPRVYLPGDTASVCGIPDENLEPWRDMDWNAKDESHRYLPPVPAPSVRITTPTETHRV
jgi:hypothetical protein